MNQTIRYDGDAGNEVTQYFIDVGQLKHTHLKVDEIKQSVSN